MSQDSQNQEVLPTVVPQRVALSESFKEAARWVIAFVIAQALVSLGDMVNLLPKELPIYFQSGFEPIAVLQLQAAMRMMLTLLTRAIDKYIHVKSKEEIKTANEGPQKLKGLFWF